MILSRSTYEKRPESLHSNTYEEVRCHFCVTVVFWDDGGFDKSVKVSSSTDSLKKEAPKDKIECT